MEVIYEKSKALFSLAQMLVLLAGIFFVLHYVFLTNATQTENTGNIEVNKLIYDYQDRHNGIMPDKVRTDFITDHIGKYFTDTSTFYNKKATFALTLAVISAAIAFVLWAIGYCLLKSQKTR